MQQGETHCTFLQEGRVNPLQAAVKSPQHQRCFLHLIIRLLPIGSLFSVKHGAEYKATWNTLRRVRVGVLSCRGGNNSTPRATHFVIEKNKCCNSIVATQYTVVEICCQVCKKREIYWPTSSNPQEMAQQTTNYREKPA